MASKLHSPPSTGQAKLSTTQHGIDIVREVDSEALRDAFEGQKLRAQGVGHSILPFLVRTSEGKRNLL